VRLLSALLGLCLLVVTAPEALAQVPSTQCTTSALAGGTADALTLPRLPCQASTTVVIVKFSLTNLTGAPTMQAVGQSVLPVQRSNGSAIGAGEMVAGDSAIFTQNGVAWIRLTPGPNSIVTPATWTLPGTTATLSPQSYLGPALTAPALSVAGPGNPPGPNNNFQITAWNQLLLGNIVANLPQLDCAGNSWDLCGTAGDGIGGAPIVRIYGDQISGDYVAFGAHDSQALQVGQLIGIRSTGAIPSPEFLLSCENCQSDDGTGGAQIQLSPDSLGCCGPGPYRAGQVEGIVSAGTGYVKGEVITLGTGGTPLNAATAKVLSVDGSGHVTAAFLNNGGAYTAPASGTITLSQTASSGAGTGASFGVSFGPPPFPGTQGAIQFIAYNRDVGGHQMFNFFGRSGPGTLNLIAQITEAQVQLPIVGSGPGSGGGLYVCVDSTGVLYKKSSCP
jgi:hypothetical protein